MDCCGAPTETRARPRLDEIKLKVRGDISRRDSSITKSRAPIEKSEFATSANAPGVTLTFAPSALATPRRSDGHGISINCRYAAHIVPESGTSLSGEVNVFGHGDLKTMLQIDAMCSNTIVRRRMCKHQGGAGRATRIDDTRVPDKQIG
jgi:hypothetical protein